MIPHHNPHDEELLDQFFRQAAGNEPRKWPDGRVSGDDDGEVVYCIAADPVHNIVRIQFPSALNWLGLDIISARQLAVALTEKADQLEQFATLKTLP